MLCIAPDVIEATAEHFVREFPGTVLYAVKANPHPLVLEAVAAGGVTHFDAASLGEIELVTGLIEGADVSFNNPVKAAAAIERAHVDFGVRDFVVDHADELAKVLDVTGSDVTIQVRLGRPSPSAVVDLSSKFGADPDTARDLLEAVRSAGALPAASFHTGWQTQDPGMYREMLELALGLAEDLAYVNVGGGFPSVFKSPGIGLMEYFDAVRSSPVPLRCEPGSAMVTEGAVLAARVLLRKDEAVYLNTGIYGGLNEHLHYPRPTPVRVVDQQGEEVESSIVVEATVFGPTCDSLDVLPNRYRIPASTKAGDWLLFGLAGAYSNALRTDFNALGQLDVVPVGRLPAPVEI